MGDRNIKKEVKKPKKTDKKVSDVFISSTPRPVVVQPELLKKRKSNMPE